MEPLDVRLRTNLRRGVLEYSVLALVHSRDVYGKALAAELMGRDLIASEGSLYPLLARLREEGLIQRRGGEPEGRRRFYEVTAEGRGYILAFEAVWDSIVVQVASIQSERLTHG